MPPSGDFEQKVHTLLVEAQERQGGVRGKKILASADWGIEEKYSRYSALALAGTFSATGEEITENEILIRAFEKQFQRRECI